MCISTNGNIKLHLKAGIRLLNKAFFTPMCIVFTKNVCIYGFLFLKKIKQIRGAEYHVCILPARWASVGMVMPLMILPRMPSYTVYKLQPAGNHLPKYFFPLVTCLFTYLDTHLVKPHLAHRSSSYSQVPLEMYFCDSY